MGIFRGTGGTGDSTTDTTVTTVTEKAAEAASSATSAADSATSAANSASSASTSETNAATSETNAATSETNAATSATNAATSATSASTSATTATTKASEASTSATNAATSATAAQTAQTAAEAAQTAAETAETNAETAEANTLAIFGDATDVQNAVDDAEKLAINPEDSQYTLSDGTTTGYSALHHAAKAEDHKTAAEVSKNAAETAETAAETAQGLAETAKTAAETAQSAAETAQAAAELAQSNAETVYDDFDDRYLGTKSGDPLVDNDNEGLTTGTLYFNTTENEMRVYTGTAWVAVVDLAGDITVNSLTSNNDVVVKGNLEVQGTAITVDSATAQTIDLGDNDKIRFGDGDDLQVYHDGTDSYIANTTGTLKLSGNTDVTGNITVSGTVDGRDVATDGSKLDGIESGADVTDTANVTAAGALMDSEVTNLAQVKAFDSADYATAAQGTTADNALPTAGGTLTGDLAFGDNVKATFGASDDLQIYHDGSTSYIKDAGTGNLDISTNGVAIRLVQGNGNRLVTAGYGTGGVKLWYGADDAEKLATTSSGVDITGTVVADGLTVDGDVTITQSAGGTFLKFDVDGTADEATIGIDSTDLIISSDPTNVRFGSSIVFKTDGVTAAQVRSSGDFEFFEDTGTTAKLTWDASAEELQFKDGVKAEFGDGGDLVIYHDGSNTRIQDLGTGGLFIGGSQVALTNSTATEYIVRGFENGAVSLYYDNSAKLATTSTGIDVTGTVTADGLTVDGGGGSASIVAESTTGYATATLKADTSDSSSGGTPELRFELGGTQKARFRVDTSDNVEIATGTTQGTKRFRVASNGDVSLFDSAGTSQDLYWDASTSRLGIGTTSPAYTLDVRKSVSFLFYGQTDATSGSVFRLRSNAGSTDIFEVKADGKVGIGTTSPSEKLEVSGGDLKVTNGDILQSGNFVFKNIDNDAYLQSATGKSVIIRTNGGSEAMRIDSSGNVGIGTTSPDNKLQIYNGADADIILRVDGADASTEYIALGIQSGLGVLRAGGVGTTSTGLRFDVANAGLESERMRIDSSGRVGIGTTSPSSAYTGANNLVIGGGSAEAGLTIYSSTTTDGNIYFADGTAAEGAAAYRGYLEYSHNSNYFRIGVNGSEAARIDSSGNLGIGLTPESTTRLHLKQSTDTDINGLNGIRINRSTGTTYGGFGLNEGNLRITSGDAGGSANTNIAFRTASSGSESEAMRIDSSGNVGIGTTSPNEKLDVLGSIFVNDNDVTNNAEKQSIKFGGASGLSANLAEIVGYRGSNANYGELLFKTANGTTPAERMRIDSSGRLGIGTTSPGDYDSQAENLVISTSGNSGLTINSGTSSNGNIFFADGTSGDAAYRGYIQYQHTQDRLRFGTAGSEAMRIDSSGRVGIGTTSPSTTLSISSASANGINLEVDQNNSALSSRLMLSTGTSGQSTTLINKSGALAFQTGATPGTDSGSEAARIDSSGNVGIGTTSPDLSYFNANGKGLEIETSGTPTLTLSDSSFGTAKLHIANQSGSAKIYNESNAELQFGTNGSEAVRIDSSGNLLVGTTTTSSTAVGAKVLPTGRLTLVTADSGTQFPVQFGRETTGVVGTITTTASATSYNTSSDYRLKENVVDVTDSVDRIKQLPVRQFNFIADPATIVDGFMAHEVQNVVPQAVTGSKDEVDSDGNPVYQSIDHSKLVPLLTAALQEALTRIESLENQVSNLTGGS
jgi:hypothetical protein